MEGRGYIGYRQDYHIYVIISSEEAGIGCQNCYGGIYVAEKGGLLVSLRSATVFRSVVSFTSALDGFDVSAAAIISAHLMHFEKAWKASRHDGEIPTGFVFEAYIDVDGPYRLCQIRVGPGHGFRAIVMFLDNSPEGYWIYIFKKVRDRQPDDMKRARTLAQRLWDELEKRDKHGKR